jgi:hypothetical protein
MGAGISFVQGTMHVVVFLGTACRHLDMHWLRTSDLYQEFGSIGEGVSVLNR